MASNNIFHCLLTIKLSESIRVLYPKARKTTSTDTLFKSLFGLMVKLKPQKNFINRLRVLRKKLSGKFFESF